MKGTEGTVLLLVWLVAINLAAFFAMVADKKNAQQRKRRIPEKTLFALALLGGSAGAWVGMYWMHHKTRHWYFVVGMPLILAAQLVLAYTIRRYF